MVFLELSGALGLWLGISMVSAVEILAFAMQVILLIVRGKEIRDPGLPMSKEEESPKLENIPVEKA